MTNSYPSTLTIEIDRSRLRNYLRTRWFLSWTLPISLFGLFFGLAPLVKAIDHGLAPWPKVLLLAAKGFGLGFGGCFLLGCLCYFIFSHWVANRLATSLEVSVEGSFLRIRQRTHVLTDRKLHFRSIVDYATAEDSLMRYFGVQALQMTTTGGGQNSTLIIFGIKDCLKVRDLLSEIDRQRENQ